MGNNSEMPKEEMEPHSTRKRFSAKFNLREFGGALGDWGTLIPIVIGYILPNLNKLISF